MRFSFGSVLLCITAMIAVIGGGANATFAQQSVLDGYKVPTITIPYAYTKPTIDGVINDKEWQGAASINALQTTDKNLSPRQTRFWVMWDENNLYVAMRSPLRPGERPIEALRQKDHDVNAVFDDAYEIWLDVGSHNDDGPVFFQYLSNFAGARWDVMQEPAVGNSRPSWTAGWQPKSTITPDGGAWEMEVAIPRTSVLKDTPFADGFEFAGLMTRDYKRPWDQVSVGGSGSFSVVETFTHYVLAKNAPAIHLLSVGDPQNQTFGMSLGAYDKDDATLHWSYDSDAGTHKSGDLDVPAGQMARISGMLGLDTPGSGGYRIKVTDGDKTLLDWASKRTWGDLTSLNLPSNQADTGDQVSLSLQYNPVHDYVRVTGDFIGFDARNQIAHAHVTVRDSAGKLIAEKDVHLDSLAYVNDVIHMHDLPVGDYVTTLTASDASGKQLFSPMTKKFTKKDPTTFPWWNTTAGNIERVLQPWTPVRYSDDTFAVWGRTMHVGSAGLPDKIVAAGHDLLAGSSQLVAVLADGKTVSAGPATIKTISTADHRMVIQAVSMLGDITVTSTVTVEFDGMYKVDMTLDPAKATEVKSLKLIVPYKNEVANYINACGEGIRYGFDFRYLPTTKTGSIWDCLTVDGQPMKVGSFIPFLWIGNPQGGLSWFADSDEGWVPNNSVPAIEVRRDSAASTDLVLNLISSDFTISDPRKITFAFQATPIRPMAHGWRMNSWTTSDSFKDWANLESDGHAGNEGLIFDSIPFPLNPAKSKQMVDERHQEQDFNFGVGMKYPANAVPYLEHIHMGGSFVPESDYFGDEWKTNVTNGQAYGKTLQDFYVYNINKWIDQAGIDGIYLDNITPVADDNIEAGRGYRLPDGQIQPTYLMFDTRKYFLRLRAIFQDHGKSGMFVLHVTNHMITPWIGAADVALDGEHHVIYPEMGKDFMDFWSLERMHVDYPEQFGIPVNFLKEYQGNWPPDKLKTVMRAYSGEVILNDTLASNNSDGLTQDLWQARDRFGIEADDVQFHAYFDPNRGFDSNTKDIYLSGWTRPGSGSGGKLLLAVVNMGEATTAHVTIDAAKLGLPSPGHWSVTNAETQDSLPTNGRAEITVDVPRHDYRLIQIVPSN